MQALSSKTVPEHQGVIFGGCLNWKIANNEVPESEAVPLRIFLSFTFLLSLSTFAKNNSEYDFRRFSQTAICA